jgi:hypothetical protein
MGVRGRRARGARRRRERWLLGGMEAGAGAYGALAQGEEAEGALRGVWERRRGMRALWVRWGRRVAMMRKRRRGRRGIEAAEVGGAPEPEPEPEPELLVWPVFQPAGGLWSLGWGFSFCGVIPAGQE